MTRAATRRGFVAGAGLIALAPVLVHATPAGAVSQRDVRLTRAIALHRRAEAECDRFDALVERPACEAYIAEVKAYPTEPPPPHEEVATTFLNYEYKVVRLSTGGRRQSIDWR